METNHEALNKPQDLFLCQLLHTANLCWLRKRGLPQFNLATQSNAGDGTLELHFGIPATHLEAHQSLLNDWLHEAKKVERLYLLLKFIQEGQQKDVSPSILEEWQKEGEILRAQLFDTDLPGVYTDIEQAIESAKG